MCVNIHSCPPHIHIETYNRNTYICIHPGLSRWCMLLKCLKGYFLFKNKIWIIILHVWIRPEQTVINTVWEDSNKSFKQRLSWGLSWWMLLTCTLFKTGISLWIIKIEMYILVNTDSQLMLEWLTGEILVHAENRRYSSTYKEIKLGP